MGNLEDYKTVAWGKPTSITIDGKIDENNISSIWNVPIDTTFSINGETWHKIQAPKIESPKVKKCESEEKTMELLNIYETRKRNQIMEERDKEIDSLGKDEAYKKIKKVIDEIEKEEIVEIGFSKYDIHYTNKIENKVNEITENYKKLLHKLAETIKEIKAQLELAETYEQKLDVLMNYDIIDKKTKKLTI